MSVSRASSLRSLHRLAARSTQLRKLHMTRPATFPSPLLTSERPAITLPRDLAGLRSECKKRKLPTTGSKSELIDRLSGDELIHSRAFTTAVDQPNKPSSTLDTAQPSSGRQFNNDSSTIDFACPPDFDPDMDASPASVRVPLLPDFNSSPTTISYAGEALEMAESPKEVMRPTISTVSAVSTHLHSPSAMAEVHDNNSIDFQGMADKVQAAAEKWTGAPAQEQEPMLKQVWNGMLDDVFGAKSAKA